MTEDKIMELLKIVGGLEYIVMSHVADLAVRDRLIAKVDELDTILKNLPKGGK